MARKPKSKKKKILFAVEIIVLLVFIGGLYVYGQLNTKLDKIQQPVLDESKIQVNQEVQDSIDSETFTLTGYTTYALLVLTTVTRTLLLVEKTVIQLLLQVSTTTPRTLNLHLFTVIHF